MSTDCWPRQHFLRLLMALMLLTAPAALLADGGMYPISMINKLPLRKAGLRIPVNEIYNPDGQGLMQAIVQLGGCTGSFVSDKGLIITNHHCAFGSLQPYSTPENNLLEAGYLAQSTEKELPMRGLTCRIMVSHRDVSEEALRGTDAVKDAIERKKLIEVNLQKVQQLETARHSDLLIDISEMLPGKSYILFRYQLLKDIRIVYVPPRDIGEFGGESDNWVWPRHSGDFSFVRAYVAPDGSAADYSASNVPFQPKEYLNVNADGVNDGDFVFVLGYPGRTYRNQPAAFVSYQEEVLLPYISQLFEWQINTIEKLGETDSKYHISMSPRVKSLANTKKNFQGKLKAMDRLNFTQTKIKSEAELGNRLKAQPGLLSSYMTSIKDINILYDSLKSTKLKHLWYGQLFNNSPQIDLARHLYLYEQQRQANSADGGNATAMADLMKELRQAYRNMYPRFDSLYLRKMTEDAQGFEGANAINGINRYGSKGFWKQAFANSKILDSTYVFAQLAKDPSKLFKSDDPFLSLVSGIWDDVIVTEGAQQRYEAELERILPKYVDAKMEAVQQTFVPDANRTLRITYGYIKGYRPADGAYYKPTTTLIGMWQKNGSNPDYVMDDQLHDMVYKAINDSNSDLENQPVNMLYNTDTTGGNSGSPVLNKFGQLVGVNFDRSYEATINDFGWDDSYSRSIGVDIRFVLFVLDKVSHADGLMKEMFIDKNK